MRMRSKLLTTAVALGATAWLLWPGAGDDGSQPADGGAQLLLDRVWITLQTGKTQLVAAPR